MGTTSPFDRQRLLSREPIKAISCGMELISQIKLLIWETFLLLQKRTNDMKTKFTAKTDSNLLGSTILAVRKSKGITQEELGRRVGLGKSSISKIEKGLTHISAEDAAILLEAMGEQLVFSASGIDESPATKEQKTKFITTGVSWFAEENKLSFAKAYQFLLLYKGIDFLESSFRYEQTLPRAIVLQDLSRICANNGGRL